MVSVDVKHHVYLFNLEHCPSLRGHLASVDVKQHESKENIERVIVQELCESRGGRPGLSVPMNLMVSVDVKLY